MSVATFYKNTTLGHNRVSSTEWLYNRALNSQPSATFNNMVVSVKSLLQHVAVRYNLPYSPRTKIVSSIILVRKLFSGRKSRDGWDQSRWSTGKAITLTSGTVNPQGCRRSWNSQDLTGKIPLRKCSSDDSDTPEDDHRQSERQTEITTTLAGSATRTRYSRRTKAKILADTNNS